jgi:hypothetical protein
VAGTAFLVDMLRCIYYIHDSNIRLRGGGYTRDIVHSGSDSSAVGTI